MVHALEKFPGNNDRPPKKLDPAQVNNISDTSLDNFVTSRSLRFFKSLQIDTDFLKQSPAQWKSCKSYLEGQEKVRALQVVNDCAERGVKLMEDFNNILKNDEEQKQYLLFVVEEHRKRFPDAKKTTI
ncbi:unnamed protein product, partial [Rotaria socialis]